MELKFQHKNLLFNFLRFETPDYSEEDCKIYSYKDYELNTTYNFEKELNLRKQNFLNELKENSFQKDFPKYVKMLLSELKEIDSEIKEGEKLTECLLPYLTTGNFHASKKDAKGHKIPLYYVAFIMMTGRQQEVIDLLHKELSKFKVKKSSPVNSPKNHTPVITSQSDRVKKIEFKYTKQEILNFFLLLMEAQIISEFTDPSELEKFFTNHFLFSDSRNEETFCVHSENNQKVIFKISNVMVHSFFWLLRSSAIINNLNDATLGEVIALHFMFTKKNLPVEIKAAEANINFSKCKEHHRLFFKERWIQHIHTTWDNFGTTPDDGHIHSESNENILNKLKEAPVEKAKPI